MYSREKNLKQIDVIRINDYQTLFQLCRNAPNKVFCFLMDCFFNKDKLNELYKRNSYIRITGKRIRMIMVGINNHSYLVGKGSLLAKQEKVLEMDSYKIAFSVEELKHLQNGEYLACLMTHLGEKFCFSKVIIDR